MSETSTADKRSQKLKSLNQFIVKKKHLKNNSNQMKRSSKPLAKWNKNSKNTLKKSKRPK